MFSSSFLSWFVSRMIMQKLVNRFFYTKFGGNVVLGPQKKAIDFGGNPDDVTS